MTVPTTEQLSYAKPMSPGTDGNMLDAEYEGGADHSAPDTEKNTGDRSLSLAESNHEERSVRGLSWFIVCLSIFLIDGLYGLDTTVAADVQGAVTEAFGHVEQLAWVGTGFPLGSVCVVSLFGTIYSSFNIKWTFVFSIVLFEAGSALCGGAPNMDALIVGRVIAGAGGSGIYLGSLHFIAALTTPKERGLYMALIGSSWGVGAILGPVVGGAFSVSSATWRWAFYINLVIGGVLAPAYVFALPSIHPVQGISIRDRLARVDFVGCFLCSGMWTSFLLAFTMAGAQWPWNDGRTIGTFVAFGVALVAYILQQYFAMFTTPLHRAFPGHLLRDRTQVLLYVATAAGITTLYVMIYFIPIYFQFVNNDTALMAAVRLLPDVIVAITVNLVSGHLLSTIKVYMALYLTSGVFLTVGGAFMVVYLHPGTSTGVIYGLSVVIAIGSGLTMLMGFSVATLTLKPEDVGAGIGMQNLAQIGAQVVALAIAGQIFQSTAVRNLETVLAGHGFSAADIRGAVAGAQSGLFNSLSGELRDAATLAVTEAIQRALILLPVAGGVLFLAALCMKREKVIGSAPAVGA